MRWILLAAALAVAGCADRPAVSTCPVPMTYSLQTQRKAADELKSLPPGSTLGQMMTDYGQERSALRACNGG
jgi:hypothetical protein